MEQLEHNGKFEIRAFGKDTLVYVAGNFLLLLFGLVQTFIIPKYLSVDEYGYWQFFLLYSLYTGILHLGFIDGILLHWAGKDIKQIGGELKPSLLFLLLQQIAIILPIFLIISFILQPPYLWIGLMLCAYAFIINITSFYIYTTQAIRKFPLFVLLNTCRGLLFTVIVVLLLVIENLQYQYIILGWMAVDLFLLVAFMIYYRNYVFKARPSWSSLMLSGKSNIYAGIFILLGNFVFVIFRSLDRLVVSSFFPIDQFAMYAFAMSMANVVFRFIKPIADVLFPYLAATTQQRENVFITGKQVLILCWALFLILYFPLTKFIQFYLPQYTESLSILKIVMGTIVFSSTIFILHVNYYRLYRQQRQYFFRGSTMLVFAILLSITFIKVQGTLTGAAIAILISYILWFVINGFGLKSVTGETIYNMAKDLIIICCYFTGFWFAEYLEGWFIQMLLYLVFFLIISFIFSGSNIRKLVIIMKNSISKTT